LEQDEATLESSTTMPTHPLGKLKLFAATHRALLLRLPFPAVGDGWQEEWYDSVTTNKHSRESQTHTNAATKKAQTRNPSKNSQGSRHEHLHIHCEVWTTVLGGRLSHDARRSHLKQSRPPQRFFPVVLHTL